MTYGIDISHYNGIIDWSTTSKYVSFALLKATEHTSFVDGRFATNKLGCIYNNLPWGAYHFLRSNYNAITQANHFVNTVGAGCNVYVCDVETMDGQSGATVISQVKAFVDKVEQLTSRKPMIYTAAWFWDGLPTPLWCNNYPLWVADYSPPLTLPKGFATYKIRQICDNDKIFGIQSLEVDGNLFSGTLSDIQSFFGNGTAKMPKVPDKIIINTGSLYIRNAPIVSANTIIGNTSSGKVWYPENVVYVDNCRRWYQVGKSAYLAGYNRYTLPTL